jgi:hypothetical protein
MTSEIKIASKNNVVISHQPFWQAT